MALDIALAADRQRRTGAAALGRIGLAAFNSRCTLPLATRFVIPGVRDASLFPLLPLPSSPGGCFRPPPQHGWSSYDASKPIDVSGQLQEVRWVQSAWLATAVYNSKVEHCPRARVADGSARATRKCLQARPAGRLSTLGRNAREMRSSASSRRARRSIALILAA